MSIYNIIAKNKITTPFIQFTKEQNNLEKEINHIFEQYIKNTVQIRNRFEHESIKTIINSNNIIYNNEKIILFNFIELLIHDGINGNELLVKVLHPINKEYFLILNCLGAYYDQFLILMSNWKRIYTQYNGIEFQIPINDLNNLKYKILTGKINKDENIIIPFNEHFKKYLNKFSESLDKEIENLTLLINFDTTELSQTFTYFISLYENEKEYSLTDPTIVSKTDIDQFLKNLFIYGKI